MFNRLLGFHNPTPPNGAGLRHVANEVRCASKNVVPLLDIFDAPFERTFRISFRELLRWLPTIPVPIHVVHNSWPRDLQSRLPLRQFRRLALSHYTVFHVQCGVEHDALAVMAQPYLHEIEGYGSFDAALVTYAFEELQDVIKVAQSAEPTFVSTAVICQVNGMSRDDLLRYSDILSFSDDFAYVKLRYEASMVRCFQKPEEPMNVNSVLNTIAGSVPTRFVHMGDIAWPPSVDHRCLFLNALSHSVEWKYPYVRLRDDFQHPSKGTAVLPRNARYLEDATVPAAVTCSHNVFFRPSIGSASQITSIEFPSHDEVKLFASNISAGDVVGMHVLKQPHLPGVLALSRPSRNCAIIVPLSTAHQSDAIKGILRDSAIVKMVQGFTPARCDVLLQRHDLCIRGWVNVGDLVLFSGYPLPLGRRITMKMLLHDVGGIALDDVNAFDNISDLNWSAVALSSHHHKALTQLFALDCGANRLWQLGNGAVSSIVEGQLSKSQLAAINSTVRSWELQQTKGTQTMTIPSPCPKEFAKGCYHRLVALARNTAVEAHPRVRSIVTSPAPTVPVSTQSTLMCNASSSQPGQSAASDVASVFLASTLSDLETSTPAIQAPRADNHLCASQKMENDVTVEEIDIASALADVAFDEVSAPPPEADQSSPLSVHELLAQRLSLLNQAPSARANIPHKKYTPSPSPSPPPLQKTVPSGQTDVTTPPPAHHESTTPSDIASLLADIVLPVEYVSPHISEIPPLARLSTTAQLPPSTRAFSHSYRTNGAVKERAPQKDAASLPSTNFDLSPEMRRKIAEDWLKENIGRQASD